MNYVFEPDKDRVAVYDGEKEIGECAFTRKGDRVWAVTHTGVSPDYGGRGIAKILFKRVLEEAERAGVKILPVCSFALAEFRKNPDYAALLADEAAL
jgi:predicted GNAT family acetyltransferase